MKKILGLIMVLGILVAASGVGWGVVPNKISFTGKLTGLSGPRQLTFTFYDALTGGNLVDTADHPVTVTPDPTSGIFSTEIDTAGTALVFDRPYWVEIKVGETVLSPRQALNTVPYAFRAALADSVVGGSGGGQWSSSGSNIYYSGGNVGIGSNTNPTARLQVVGPTSGGGYGVTGAAMGNIGILGEGVEVGAGVAGVGDNGYGVYGRSTNKIGVFGGGGAAGGSFESVSGFGVFAKGPKNFFSGKIGIGTLNPEVPLDVIGGGYLNEYSSASYPYLSFRRYRGYPTSPSAVQYGDVLGGIFFWGYGNGLSRSGASIRAISTGAPVSYAPSLLSFSTSNGSVFEERMVINDVGNIGIGTGTTNPTSKLQIKGTTNTSYVYLGANEDIYLRPGKDTGSLIIDRGKVAVGTTSPTSPLHVVGPTSLKYAARFEGGSDGALYVNGNSHLFGNVGIGTPGPSSPLHVVGSTSLKYAARLEGGSDGSLYADRIDAYATSSLGIALRAKSSKWHALYSYADVVDGLGGDGLNATALKGAGVYGQTLGSYITKSAHRPSTAHDGKAVYAHASGNSGNKILYYGNLDTTTTGYKYLAWLETNASEKFTVDSNGGVWKAGSVAGGDYHGKYADIAEWIKASDKALEPGDVVVLDQANAKNIKKSARPADKLVAGIISEKPSFLGGYLDELMDKNTPDAEQQMAAKGYVKLALAGQVKTKVSAENGPIEIGDLLITSATPGCAMKAPENPRLGTVLGKALEPLSAGTGKIIVLVTLQ
ncbi:MAG: hypothetical protein WC529_07495 [Candidatus Margulisiibacteriota bacterium]